MQSTIDGSSSAITPEDYRHVLGHFISGVTIVTGMSEGKPVGLACQAFTSLSIDPPLILVCVAKTSSSWPRIKRSGHFAVNLLSESQEDVCKQFGRSGANKFEGISWHPAERTGAPLIEGSVGWIECEISQILEGGDHWIVVGAVQDLAACPQAPLTYFRGAFNQTWRTLEQ